MKKRERRKEDKRVWEGERNKKRPVMLGLGERKEERRV
jgi:hypothetical protein